jgi:hypothetical protein
MGHARSGTVGKHPVMPQTERRPWRFRGNAGAAFHKPSPRKRLLLQAGVSSGLSAEPWRMSVSLGARRRTHFPSGLVRTVQDSSRVCPMSTWRGPERKEAVSQLSMPRTRRRADLEIFGHCGGVIARAVSGPRAASNASVILSSIER